MAKRELISLFCGPGGLDLGFRQAGFLSRLAYDNDPACVDTYNTNQEQPSLAKLADLAAADIAGTIIRDWCSVSTVEPAGVIGGPPCQSFSVSNVHPRQVDERHGLPERYAEILAELNLQFKVDFFVFENVPGLVTKKHIHRYQRFFSLFERAGFRVFEAALDAQDFDVAQVRRRIFIVGLNKEKFPDVAFVFPKGSSTKPKTVNEVIGGLPEPTFFSRNLKEIPYHPNHWCMVPRSRKFTNGTLQPGKRTGRSFRVLDGDKPSYAVAYGNREVHIHPNCNRRLSVLEAMLIQGFPGSYKLKGTLSDQIRLVSEAVPPPVARALAESLRGQLYVDPTVVENSLQLGLQLIHPADD